MRAEPHVSAGRGPLLESARRAVLATIAPAGHPRLVPSCFVLAGEPPILYTPIDDKPKRTEDPLALARVRDIAADPRVTVLVDRWDEDWTRLAWLRSEGRATLLKPSDGTEEHSVTVAALRVKYRQYATHGLDELPLIRIALERVIGWGPHDVQLHP